MAAVLDAPRPTTKRKRTPGTWNAEQAQAARTKSLETRRKNAIERKQVKEKAAQFIETLSASDPLTHVELALAAAAKRGNAKACEHLALAVSRLRRTPEPVCGPSPLASVTYTPTNGIAPRQPTPSTPQVTQAHAPQGHVSEVSFAQCTEHLVGPAKESIVSQPVGCPGPGEAPDGQAAGGVSEHITRTAYSSPEQEIAALEARLAVLKKACLNSAVISQQVKPVSVGGPSVVGPVPSVGVAPMEKFCVNGVWIAGVRKK